MLKLANIYGLAAVLDISSEDILFYGMEYQKSAYADFKQLRKTGINSFSSSSTCSLTGLNMASTIVTWLD